MSCSYNILILTDAETSFLLTHRSPPPSTPPRLNESFSTSPATSIHYTLPATIRRGNTLARSTDDPDAYYITELGTARLDEIKSYLWLAGLPNCARPLHRQQLLGREIITTEEPVLWILEFCKLLEKSILKSCADMSFSSTTRY